VPLALSSPVERGYCDGAEICRESDLQQVENPALQEYLCCILVRLSNKSEKIVCSVDQ